jgi:hypothetical protein
LEALSKGAGVEEVSEEDVDAMDDEDEYDDE